MSLPSSVAANDRRLAKAVYLLWASGRAALQMYFYLSARPIGCRLSPSRMLHTVPFFVNLAMKALVVTPKNDSEFKFLADLLKKLGVSSSALSYEDLEDLGMSKLMRGVDKTKKTTRAEVMKKLSA
jgi:hypothetical protein